MPDGDDARRSFTRMDRSVVITLLYGVLAASLPMGGAMAQFNTPDIPICDPCAFPLVADVDLNGSPDLIFTSPELESIIWRANDGAGNFGADQFLAINQRHLTIRLAEDVDGDNDIDLIGVTLPPFTDSLVAILRNQDGFYVLDTIDHPVSGPRTMEQLEDLDTDGDLDALSLNNGTEDLWYRNDGDSAYVRERIGHWCLATGGPYVPIDAEGDGDPDLARYVFEDTENGDGRWVLFWNLGSGRFGPWSWATSALPQVAQEPAAGKYDVDADGLEDLVLGGLVSYSNGNGTFTTSGGLPTQFRSQSITNVNCGSMAEAVLSDPNYAVVSVRRLDEVGSSFNIAPAPSSAVRTELHDLNGDGRIDLLMGAFADPGPLSWRDNNAVIPDVTFELPVDTLTAGTVFFLADPAYTEPDDGGYFSGAGVVGDQFYSGLSGIGDIPITYHYLSFNTQSLCGNTATDTVHVQAMIGMDDLTGQPFTLSPDPADGWIDIACGADVILSVVITDAQGREAHVPIQPSGVPDTRMRAMTSSLPEGAYVVRVLTARGAHMSAAFLVSHAGD